MPRKLEMDALQSEEAGIRALLEEARTIDDPVGELQYAQRLGEIKAHLDRLRASHTPLASVALFFGGKPVLGSLGIASDFAGKVLRGYQEVISKTFAKAELGEMGKRGPVPFKQDTTLMVTGLAHGSFGFVLNELSEQTELHDTVLKEVVSAASALIAGVSDINEARFEEVSEDLDPRTLGALRKFFNDLDIDGATIRIVDDDRELKLNETEIHRARMRTEATEIDEIPVEVEGVLAGFLPDHRRFEFRGLDGKAYYGIASKEATEQFRNAIDTGTPILGKNCVAGIIIRTVRSLNKPPRFAYRLTEFYRFGDHVPSLEILN